jgi:hypothetical protein
METLEATGSLGSQAALAATVDAGFWPYQNVSKPNPLELWDLPLSEEQTPHIVEKPKNRRDAMEPKEASCGLHTQEVAGSSPVAPTIKYLTPDSRTTVSAIQHHGQTVDFLLSRKSRCERGKPFPPQCDGDRCKPRRSRWTPLRHRIDAITGTQYGKAQRTSPLTSSLRRANERSLCGEHRYANRACHHSSRRSAMRSLQQPAHVSGI